MLPVLRIASVLLLLVLLVGSAAVYPMLPERIPMHFDFRGNPDGWSETSVFGWFILPGAALFVFALTVGSSWLIRRNPHLMNIPNRKKFESLPREAQQTIIGYVEVFLYLVALQINILFIAIAWGAWLVAHGAERVPWPVLGVGYASGVMAVLAGPLFMWFVLNRADRLHRQHSGAGVANG